MQRSQRFGVEQGVVVAEADLRQARALAYQDGKRAWADLGIERTVVAAPDAIEAAGFVGDHAGEDVEPAGRALGIGGGGNVIGQRQAFDQRHDVDAAGFQHRPIAERDFVELQLLDALGDRCVRTRQEARADTVGHLAEPEIEARRLNLVGHEIIGRQDRAILRERGDHVIGQNALLIDCKGERHAAIPR